MGIVAYFWLEVYLLYINNVNGLIGYFVLGVSFDDLIL